MIQMAEFATILPETKKLTSKIWLATCPLFMNFFLQKVSSRSETFNLLFKGCI